MPWGSWGGEENCGRFLMLSFSSLRCFFLVQLLELFRGTLMKHISTKFRGTLFRNKGSKLVDDRSELLNDRFHLF